MSRRAFAFIALALTCAVSARAAGSSLATTLVRMGITEEPGVPRVPGGGGETPGRTAAPAPFARPLHPLTGSHQTVGDERNPVVVPRQRLDLVFDHSLHVTEAELSCLDCHETVRSSKRASDFNIPTREACTLCHAEEEIPWQWGEGVAAAASAIDIPPAHVRFSHDLHLEGDDDEQCSACHADVMSKSLATRDDLPSMETCLACHAENGVSDDCRTCHLSGRGGTIRTGYASGALVPDDHGVHWMKQHGTAAERDMGQCASCHAQEDCVSCHEGSVAPTFHDANYLQLHPQEAFANNPPCSSCHVVDRFCRDCHFRAEVTLATPMLAGAGFHPPGWTASPAGGDHHAHPARKNVAACVACHVKEDCVGCHAFFQGAARIHPPGWATSRRMQRLRDANITMCLSCHGFGELGDPIPPP